MGATGGEAAHCEAGERGHSGSATAPTSAKGAGAVAATEERDNAGEPSCNGGCNPPSGGHWYCCCRNQQTQRYNCGSTTEGHCRASAGSCGRSSVGFHHGPITNSEHCDPIICFNGRLPEANTRFTRTQLKRRVAKAVLDHDRRGGGRRCSRRNSSSASSSSSSTRARCSAFLDGPPLRKAV